MRSAGSRQTHVNEKRDSGNCPVSELVSPREGTRRTYMRASIPLRWLVVKSRPSSFNGYWILARFAHANLYAND